MLITRKGTKYYTFCSDFIVRVGHLQGSAKKTTKGCTCGTALYRSLHSDTFLHSFVLRRVQMQRSMKNPSDG